MNTKRASAYCLAVMVLLGAVSAAQAQLPPDFPQLSIEPNTNPAPGYLFGNLSANGVPGVSNYFAILNNDGSPVYISKTNSLGKLACNGLFVEQIGTKGVNLKYISRDSSFTAITTNQAGNGYAADNHDFQVLPNGHSIVLIYDQQYMDMSAVVPGGNPAARVTGTVIQEVDVDNNVVFQWRSWDHIPVSDSYQDLKNPGGYDHVNSVWFDELDGSIILSCRNTSEAIKIDRTTGDVVWRLQGKQNQFAFTNAIPSNTDPAWFQVQHSVRRLPNGNITVFDNGYSDHSDPMYDFTRPYSRAVEYVVDETNKTATLVWQFRHDPDIITYNGGSAERLPSGHTIIQWGNDNNASPRLAMTEVDEDGNLVCDVALLQAGVTGNMTRMLWPLESQYINVTKHELIEGTEYVFNEGSTNVTGVAMGVAFLDGDEYNSVTVSRQPFAPVLPRFPGKAPRVVPVRVQITPNLITDLGGLISFEVNSLGIKAPSNTKIYYRSSPGEGLFQELPTVYNMFANPKRLEADFPGFGEFIFGFPDLAEVAYPPLLITPATDAELNQTLPVSFFWTPKGFGSSYQFQVSTNEDFSTLLTNVSGLAQTRFTLPTVAPSTRYYWRANTTNNGGTSDWATNTFTTVPPVVQVTVPAGGELWQLGSTYYVQWNANIAERIALDLYKGGVLSKSITTNAQNIGAYSWRPDLTLVPGDDYTVKVRSATNAALSSVSAPFTLFTDIGDGIPTWWRALYFGGNGTITNDQSCATCDADGDGLINLGELWSRSDPTNSMSSVRILSIMPEGDDMRITWLAAGGATNIVQASNSDALATNVFADISPLFIIPGSGEVITNHLDLSSITNAPARYYRIKLVP